MKSSEDSSYNRREFCISSLLKWIKYYQKNKPQTNALAAGLMIVLHGGQQLGWGIFNNHIQSQPWAGGYEDDGTVFWAIICWFIAGIIGFFVASIVERKYSKFSIYAACSILSATSAVLFIYRPESIYYIFPARVLAGFSHGIVYPIVLIHASEVAVPKLRGMIVSSVHLCLIVGVFTTSSSLLPVLNTRSHEVDPTRTVGINGLICIVVGLLLAIFFDKESPVFLIRKFREQDAINVMVRLRSESKETAEIRKDFNEFKQMVTEDMKCSNIFDRDNLWPILIVTVLKVLFVASFNMPLNLIWLEAAETEFYDGEYDYSGMWLSGIRLTTITVMTFFIDFKRIKFYLISSAASAAVLLLLVYVLHTLGGGFDESTIIAALALSFQFFCGIAVGLLADIYSTEAFNSSRKPLSIAFASSIEFLLQIFMVSAFFYLEISLILLMGLSGLIMAFGLFAFVIPDTSQMSLRSARNKWKSA